MAVQDGQPVSAAVTNAAFVSKTSATAQSMQSPLTMADTTQSTTKDTGALILEGGLGVEKNINAGGDIAGNNLSGTNTGDVTLAAVGSSPNANGASLTGQVLNLQPADASSPGVVSTTTQTFAGDKTIAGNLIVTGDVTIQGASTVIQTATLDVEDKNITVNDGGNDATSEGAGLTVERTGTAGSLIYADAAASKFKIGASGSEVEVADISTAQTFLNKSISGSANTITNVSLTTGVTGTLPIANGGTNGTTANAGFNNLSPLTTKGDLIAFSTVNARLPVGTNGQVLTADSAEALGVKWAASSGSGSGGINYIDNPGAEVDTTGWAAYADAAGARPVDGTGGSPTVTWTRSTSSPLRDTASFLLTKDAANRQGEGASYDFTIDVADKGKMLQINFDYLLSSGTYSGGTSSTDSDLIAYIYDVTNSRLIEPSGFKLDVSSTTVPATFRGNFQASIDSTSYRLIIHVATTSASAYVMKMDNFSVGPVVYSFGYAGSDWKDVTVASSWTTNTTVSAKMKRVGDEAEFQVLLSLSGAPNATTLTFDLPSGMSTDIDKLVASSNFVGTEDNFVLNGSDVQFYQDPSTFNAGFWGKVSITDSNTFTPVYMANNTTPNVNFIAGGVTDTSPAAFGANDRIIIHFKIPILGWSSNTLVSSETDTRVVAAKFVKTSGSQTSNDAFQDVTGTTTEFDSHGMINLTTGEITIRVPGKYRVLGKVNFTGNATGFRLIKALKNATDIGIGIGNNGSTTSEVFNGSEVDTLVDCISGDVIKFQAYQNSGGNLAYSTAAGYNYFFVERISGPSQIAATESINCRYTTDAGTSIPDNSQVTLTYEDKDFDTHGAYSSGVFTVQAPGKYEVKATARLSSGGGWIAAESAWLVIQKNSVDHTRQVETSTAAHSSAVELEVAGLVNCVTGDTIRIQIFQNSGAALTLVASGLDNTLVINRIGA